MVELRQVLSNLHLPERQRDWYCKSAEELYHERANQTRNGSSNEDINNLAAYFSKQKPVKVSGGDPELIKAGESKASMCMGCHGSTAGGNGQFPRLAGQYPEYLVQQLKAFKNGSRKSGPMQAITSTLTETDIKALAAYFRSL